MNHSCLDCLQQRPAQACSECLTHARIENGFLAFAPKLSQSNEHFNEADFAALYQLEDKHFWFQYRNKILAWAIAAFCDPQPRHRFLEIGCGTGVVLKALTLHFPKLQFFGSELSTTGLGFAAERLQTVPLFQMDARHIPFQHTFDIIGAFDVLEHIREDQQVLQQIHRALTPQGKLIISVPQHDWLWSEADVHACHIRRYSERELVDKLQQAGFHCQHSTSFVAILLPAMLLSRKRQRHKNNGSEMQLPSWLNRTFSCLLHLELFWVKRRYNLPYGGSRLIVASKVDG